MIIDLSDLFGITIDELLRSNGELKEKIIQDSKGSTDLNWKITRFNWFRYFYGYCDC